MYDLVCIGDVVVDLYFKGESLTQDKDRFSLAIGGKYQADAFYQGLGGGAANVAIDATSFELDSAVCALVGENVFKQIIIQHLVKKNVSTELLIFVPDFYNISTILLAKNGERTVIHYPTQTASFTIASHMLPILSEAKSYFFANIPQASISEKFKLLTTINGYNKPIFLNLSLDDCKHPLAEIKPLLSLADGIILNSYEFAELSKKKHENIDLNKNVAKLIGCENSLLVITDGAKGSYAYHKNEVFFQKAENVENIIDTTGVGDAYTSAFISSFIKEPDIPKSMEIATKFAAKKLTRLGAN